MRCALAIAGVLGLAACATPPPYAGADAGWLLGSLGLGTPNEYTSLEFYYRRKGGGASGALGVPPPAAAQAVEVKGSGGRPVQVYATPLPPGDYEFYTYLGYSPGGMGVQYGRPRVEFSIPFSIATGRATYVGEYVVDSRREMRSTGVQVPEARFVVGDALERDLAAARQAGRPVGSAAPVKAIPDPRRENLPNFEMRAP